jgi:hypothetical protein
MLMTVSLQLIEALPVQANLATRYVATAGTDAGNDCTSASNPWATIQHAVNVAGPGDEIHVAGGTYAHTGTVAAIGKELAIVGTNAIHSDPLLAADYHLRPGSPAVDTGRPISWLTTDLEGNPRPQGSGYDIGAFEGVRWDVFVPLALRNYP